MLPGTSKFITAGVPRAGWVADASGARYLGKTREWEPGTPDRPRPRPRGEIQTLGPGHLDCTARGRWNSGPEVADNVLTY